MPMAANSKAFWNRESELKRSAVFNRETSSRAVIRISISVRLPAAGVRHILLASPAIRSESAVFLNSGNPKQEIFPSPLLHARAAPQPGFPLVRQRDCPAPRFSISNLRSTMSQFEVGPDIPLSTLAFLLSNFNNSLNHHCHRLGSQRSPRCRDRLEPMGEKEDPG